MNDTSPEAERIQLAIYRRMTSQQRLQLAMERTSSLRWMAQQRTAWEQRSDRMVAYVESMHRKEKTHVRRKS